MNGPLTYLASPYSSAYAAVRERRFNAVCRAAGELMKQGKLIFCPIAHSHPIDMTFEEGIKDHDFWLRQDFAILQRCDALVVLTLPGWESSVGVKREIALATAYAKPIAYISMDDLGLDWRTEEDPE